MNREPLWLYATDEPSPEDTRYAIMRGWIRRAPEQAAEQEVAS